MIFLEAPRLGLQQLIIPVLMKHLDELLMGHLYPATRQDELRDGLVHGITERQMKNRLPLVLRKPVDVVHCKSVPTLLKCLDRRGR
ncbi:hypothetical protein D3C87_1936690 [compost metagenome]